MDSQLAPQMGAFERTKRLDGDREWWSDQDLRPVLGYTGDNDYENFKTVVKKARIACAGSGISVDDHFFHTNLPQMIGSIGQKMVMVEGYTKFACFLIIQNADPRKPTVRLGQVYFALQTMRMEALDRSLEEAKRIELRHQVAQYDTELQAEARHCGVVTPTDFAAFHNAGYRGLYGGMSVAEVKELRECASGETPLDRMGRTELAAHAFRITQTEQRLKKDHVDTKEEANKTHLEVAAKIRKTMAELGTPMPENLPTAPDIKQVEKRHKKELGQSAPNTLPLE